MPYLVIETAAYHLCKTDRILLGVLCNSNSTSSSRGGLNTIYPGLGPVAQALRSTSDGSTPKTVRILFPEQSTDAIIYVSVVVVFYAAIILLLVGTNLRRFNPNRPGSSQEPYLKDLVVHKSYNTKGNGSVETYVVEPDKDFDDLLLNPTRNPEVMEV